ncbi:hypothetical protein LSH36_133g00024 [Paralvinella palmiformis]|uniref:Death domain-containing protein n=1 Tax=Paralvinella palmiformis TaxID=53620 RepID=A0AAD9JYA0_9ANNE|nr:hypothetical protein LSH36_133g00024 [Paralvinella palmiformis]
MPHVASRNMSYREPVIKRMESDGSWSELDTYDVTLSDLKEYKFVETRLFDVEAMFAVVTRPRREILTISRRGGKLSPSVDVRICFAFKSMTFKTATNLEVEIQPVELTLISDLKHRKPIECDNLVASSPFIQFNLADSQLAKPMTVTIPVPPNPNKSRRPLTALSDRDGINGKGTSRPVSALSFTRELNVNEDLLYLLILLPGEGWTVSHDIHLIQSKTSDSVSIELNKPFDNRFLVIRTRGCVRYREAERIGSHIDQATRERTVQIMLRQRSDDPQRVILHCVSIAKAERYQRKLKEEGYDRGPPASNEIILHEGEKIKLGFRGNIKETSNKDGGETELVFNTHIATTRQFAVDIVDRFSQKSLDTYKGFCQLFVRGMVPRRLSKEEEKTKASLPKGQQKVEMVEGDILLCEMLITLPKPEPEAPKPIVNRAPILFKAEDVLDNDYLRHLSTVIGDEWRTLAQHLGIRRMRIQAILRNNVTMENDAVIYEMLATWAKRMPRSVNKVELLCRSLATAGRADLAEEVRDKQSEKHLENMKASRDAYLKKAFIKIAQRLPIVSEWRRLGKGLGLRSDVINRIDDKDAGVREKVTRCLNMWLDKTGDKANIILLLGVLRKCHWTQIACKCYNFD